MSFPDLSQKIFLSFFILFSSICAQSRKGASDILLSIAQQNTDLELLVSQTIEPALYDVNCVAVFSDQEYSNVFGRRFHYTIFDIPAFFVLVADEEDLLSPNYGTLKLMKAIRRSGCHVNVILMADADQVGRFLRFGDRYRELDTRANFIINHDRRLLQADLHYLWKKIVNVVFLRKFGSRPGVRPWYEIFTVPFPVPILENLYLRRLDLWRAGVFKKNALLFRDKTSDLQGEELKVVTFQHIPASFRAPAPSAKTDVAVVGGQAIGYAGVEIEALSTLSRVMNFETDIYEAPNDERWGHVNQNGSHTGLLGELSAGKADIGLGDLHHTPYNLRLTDLTIPYTTQCLTFLTPEALTDNSWQTLILPFKGYLWTGVLITLFAGAVTFYTLAKLHQTMEEAVEPRVIQIQSRGVPLTMYNNLTTTEGEPEGHFQFVQADNSLLYTFSMLLLVSLPKLPAGWSLRVLTGFWWLYSILVVVAYRASMTAILANPAPRVRIDTLDQLADSKISAGGWDEQTQKFFQTSLDTAGKKVGSRFEIERDIDKAVLRVARGEFAFYESTDFLRYAGARRQLLALEEKGKGRRLSQNDQGIDSKNLHIMADCVINMPISIGLQLNSPLKPRVDRYLRLITQGGLVQKWLQDTMSPVSAVDKTSTNQTQKALMSLKKLLGALVALGVGYLLSVLAFFVEIIYWKLTVAKNPHFDRYANAIIISKKIENDEACLNNLSSL